ncbi:hypothetical protein AURDEDRAFT_117578 [Auricularia subglabra TFB-10046 SS5]|uniref:Uncharacterized protein n=1 Tax=Auricularia subglabra (strain TFB-10046 / SS5) TaxID=717982 RepID=J0WRS0_AURST|nr:hypothetical protein AURDEDRAFT_117578 [Auricularia subglabra TFB-10046 SS5]
MPTRRCTDPEELGLPELTFAENATTSPFSISLDLAYFDFSNIPRLADGRQSIVMWYAGVSRGRLPNFVRPKPRRTRFMALPDAISLIQAQPLHDVVAVRALRLFRRILTATQPLPIPRDLKPSLPRDERGASNTPNPKDIPCYPASMMLDPIFPVPTPNTTAIVRHSSWSAADFVVRTGVVILDTQQNLVLLASGAKSNTPVTLPRFTQDDDAGRLLRIPLGSLESTCSRLALPRMWKRYQYIDGCELPRAETVLQADATTNPFFVTFKTWWDYKGETIAQSLGRQEITFWYAGAFDASLGAPANYVAVPIAEARTKLDTTDEYAFAALKLCTELLELDKGLCTV